MSEFKEKLRKLCENNPNIAYANEKVTLITYEERHVKLYHEWMSDDYTREMTCSEGMTLEEEFETRKQWHEHRYSGTFLIMDSEKFVETDGSELDSLIGDVNFVQYWEYVELLIMIGNQQSRQKGLATEAVCLMITHIGNFINERVIQACVISKNTPCMKLLEKIGFEKQSQPSTLDDAVFVLPTNKRELIEKSTSDSLIYLNNLLVEELLKRSREYFKTL